MSIHSQPYLKTKQAAAERCSCLSGLVYSDYFPVNHAHKVGTLYIPCGQSFANIFLANIRLYLTVFFSISFFA